MPNKTMEVVVERPVDGDTVRVLIDGKSESMPIPMPTSGLITPAEQEPRSTNRSRDS